MAEGHAITPTKLKPSHFIKIPQFLYGEESGSIPNGAPDLNKTYYISQWCFGVGSYVIFLLLLLLFLDYNNQVVYSIILIIKQYSMKSGLKFYNPGGITLIKNIKIITIIQKYQGFEVLEFCGTFSLYD
eukprot:393759_1